MLPNEFRTRLGLPWDGLKRLENGPSSMGLWGARELDGFSVWDKGEVDHIEGDSCQT